MAARRRSRKTTPGRAAPDATRDASPQAASWWQRFLFQPVDVASLAVFRIGFGLLMLWDMSSYTLGATAEQRFLGTMVHFTFPGFAWVRPLPDAWMYAVLWLMSAAALGITLGFLYRVSCLLFALGHTYCLLIDAANFNNHDYLLCLVPLLMAFVPAHGMLSLDARRNAKLASSHAPAWSLWLLRLQLGIPYLFGALAKVNTDWLLRGEPMTLWLRGDVHLPFAGHLFSIPALGMLMSWAGFLLDLLAVPLLIWRRSRPFIAIALVAFHLMNSQLFVIGIFPWMMLWCLTLYFDPSWPRRLRLVRSALATAAPSFQRRRSVVAVLFAAWFLVQTAIPFRHLLYGGRVDWTEEGHRFSWRMMLRDKRGKMELVGVQRATHKIIPLSEAINLSLTDKQKVMVRNDPEMMRQFAHYVADKMRPKLGNIEVHVVTDLSLNGHPRQPLVDPNVDLASTPFRWGHAPWIEPFASEQADGTPESLARSTSPDAP